jgi:hypothetical protein
MLCIAVSFAWLLRLRFMPSHYLMLLVMSLRKGYQKNATCCSSSSSSSSSSSGRCSNSSSISSRCSSSSAEGGGGVLAVLVVVWVVLEVSIIRSVFSKYTLPMAM